jgi:hypothetical protein
VRKGDCLELCSDLVVISKGIEKTIGLTNTGAVVPCGSASSESPASSITVVDIADS